MKSILEEFIPSITVLILLFIGSTVAKLLQEVRALRELLQQRLPLESDDNELLGKG